MITFFLVAILEDLEVREKLDSLVLLTVQLLMVFLGLLCNRGSTRSANEERESGLKTTRIRQKVLLKPAKKPETQKRYWCSRYNHKPKELFCLTFSAKTPNRNVIINFLFLSRFTKS